MNKTIHQSTETFMRTIFLEDQNIRKFKAYTVLNHYQCSSLTQFFEIQDISQAINQDCLRGGRAAFATVTTSVLVQNSVSDTTWRPCIVLILCLALLPGTTAAPVSVTGNRTSDQRAAGPCQPLPVRLSET